LRRSGADSQELSRASPHALPWHQWSGSFVDWGSQHAQRLEFLGDAVLGAIAAMGLARELPWTAGPDPFAAELSLRTGNGSLTVAAARAGLVEAARMPPAGKSCADAVESFIGSVWAGRGEGDTETVVYALLGIRDMAVQAGWRWPGERLRRPRRANRRSVPAPVKAAEIAAGRLFDDWSLAAYVLRGGGGAPHARLRVTGAAVVKLHLARQAFSGSATDPRDLHEAVSARNRRKWLADCQRNNRWLDSRLPADVYADVAQALVGATAWESGLTAALQAAAIVTQPRDEHAGRIAWKAQWETRARPPSGSSLRPET
jgi:dsRNA-specific ribonuclease